MSPPLVSVIIPNLNRARTILQAIDSAKRQTHGNIEIIVIDDGSTDGSYELLKNKPEVSLIRLETSIGAAKARNLGIEKAEGEFIAFLDSDDEWSPDFIEVSLGHFTPKTALTFSDYLLREGNSLRPTQLKSRLHPGAIPTIHSMSLVVVRTDIAKRIPLSSEFTIMHDREWYQQIEKEGNIIHLNRFLVLRNLGKDNLILRRKDWMRESFKFYRSNPKTPISKRGLQENVLTILFQQLAKNPILPITFFPAVGKAISLNPFSFGNLALGAISKKIRRSSFVQFHGRRIKRAFRRVLRYRRPPSVFPRSLVLYVTNQCDARCSHCFYSAELNKRERSLSSLEIAEIIKNIPEPLHVTLTGGEAFLRPDLHEISGVIASFQNVGSLTIVSNGFSPQRIASFMEKTRSISPVPIHIQVSLDGPERIHDTIRRTPGGFQKSLESLRILGKESGLLSRFSVSAHTVLQDENQTELAETLRITETLQIPHKLSLFRNSKTIFNLPEQARENRESPWDRSIGLAKGIQAITPHFGKRTTLQKKKLLLSLETLKRRRRVLPCYAGKLDYVIYSDGNVALCENTRPVGNLRDYRYRLRDVIQSAEGKEMGRLTKQCACINGCNLLTSLRVHGEYRFNRNRRRLYNPLRID